MKRILPSIILLSLILVSCASWGDREPTVALEPLVEETVPTTEEEAVAEQETALEEPLAVDDVTEDDGILPVTDEPIGGSPEAEITLEPLIEPIPEPLVEFSPEPLPEPQPIPETVPNAEAPKEEADTARIGDMVLPKWFIYTFSALFLALLMALCYMSNNRKKSLYYRGRD